MHCIEDIFPVKAFGNISFNPQKNCHECLVDPPQQEAPTLCACGHKMHVCDHGSVKLKDCPLVPFIPFVLEIPVKRYRCPHCGRKSTEKPALCHPHTRITRRLALWIQTLLFFGVSVSLVARLAGVSWNTVRKVHDEKLQELLRRRKARWKQDGYRPKRLAVDEFAIRKGHKYATVVMDLDTKEIIWVGLGRSVADFRKFFEEFDQEMLSQVEAVAMDMNAAYNRLVREYIPQADIVYDVFHFLSQYGREVLGTVRLEEAKRWREKAKELGANDKEGAEACKRRYRQLKRSRWPLLRSGASLNEKQSESLRVILAEHKDLALCHALKEEASRLFDLRSLDEAQKGWVAWFEAAIASGVPALERFARLKANRILGLVAHSVFPISTGPLEGMNNKIKVAKRLAYGFRNFGYFFRLIQALSIPSVRLLNPQVFM